MGKKITLSLCLWLIIGSIVLQAQQMVVATYNIRYDSPSDSGNLWKDRVHAVISLIRFHDFDIVGTQEGLNHQLVDITQGLPVYARVGRGRDDGKQKGEFSAILFKKDRFQLVRQGDFWLSQTPEVPSLGWDATCCNRVCSWAELREKKTGKTFFVFNAHFDHQGVQARKESSKLVLQKIRQIAKSNPVIFMGDLNGDHQSEWYQTLAESNMLKDAFKQVKYPYVNNGSFNGFGKSLNRNQIIDHIFVSSHFNVNRWGVLTDTYMGKFPSDHFPVLATIQFK